jgi:hypothetical protein
MCVTDCCYFRVREVENTSENQWRKRIGIIDGLCIVWPRWLAEVAAHTDAPAYRCPYYMRRAN